MGFIEKLKLLFKARKPATDIINQVKEVKSGWKTIGFWASLSASLLSLVAALNGVIPIEASLVASTVITFFYNVLRGAKKADEVGTKPIFQTSEFWLTVLTQLSNALTSLKTGGINPEWLAAAATMTGTALAMGQNLAGQQPSPTIATPEIQTKTS